jgi:hypothetical protein
VDANSGSGTAFDPCHTVVAFTKIVMPLPAEVFDVTVMTYGSKFTMAWPLLWKPELPRGDGGVQSMTTRPGPLGSVGASAGSTAHGCDCGPASVAGVDCMVKSIS